jgi:hypothetical protein
MKYHLATVGRLPEDIKDKNGKPILSWRVEVLPFIELPFLHDKFHLDEPWDSPHNRQLIAEMPRCYDNPYMGTRESGLTIALRPSGPGTIFDPQGFRDLNRVPSTTIMLLECGFAEGVVWTKPGDYADDPTHPVAGLGPPYWRNPMGQRGFLMVLANLDVRLVPADTDPKLLQEMFAPTQNVPAEVDLPPFRAFFEPTVFRIAWPALLISLVAVAGGARVAIRLAKGRPVSPGEMLWLGLGAAQLVYLLAFATCYRYQVLPKIPGHDENYLVLWFLPRLAATLTFLVPLWYYRSVWLWQCFFASAIVVLGIVTLDALAPHQHRKMEQSMLMLAAPLWFGAIVVAGACLSLTGRYPGWPTRQAAHWVGILVALLPFAWYCLGRYLDWVGPWESTLFVRIVD